MSFTCLEPVFIDVPSPPLDTIRTFENERIPYTLKPSTISLHDVLFAYKLGEITFNEALGYYPLFRDEVLYMCLSGKELREDANPDVRSEDNYNEILMWVKASKRGNDVHQWRIRNSLSDVYDLIKHDNVDLIDHVGPHEHYTQILDLTLTCDTKLYFPDDALCDGKWTNDCIKVLGYCDYVEKAWHDVSLFFDDLKNKLHKAFGRFKTFRVWEAHENMFPHIHVILVFLDTIFPCYNYMPVIEKGNYNKDTWYIPREFKEVFEDGWHSWIDLKVVSSTDNLGYLTKYITKFFRNGKEHKKQELTLALQWIFHKQSYAISDTFCEELKKIMGASGGEKEVLQDRLDLQMHNSSTTKNDNEIHWEFVGLANGNDVGLDTSEWYVLIDTSKWELKEEKPPPGMIDFLIQNAKKDHFNSGGHRKRGRYYEAE